LISAPSGACRSHIDFLFITDISSFFCFFFRNRCGPCKYIGPIFEKLSNEIDTVVFAKVDVDEADDVAGLCGISAMPTFQFYRNGQKVDELMGANVDALQQKIAQLK
jgi:thioredoxin 1